jgi:hypothetical protein
MLSPFLLPRLVDVLLPDGTGSGMRHDWQGVRSAPAGDPAWIAAAYLVAIAIVYERTSKGRQPAFGYFLARLFNGDDYADIESRQVRGVVRPNVGLPDAQLHTEDHLRGLVGYHLWHRLHVELGGLAGTTEWTSSPSFDARTGGGDGLGIYRDATGALIFRLWEAKSHVGSGSPSAVVGSACQQVEEWDLEYLATVCQVDQYCSPGIDDFIAQVPEMWATTDDCAGFGVSLALSKSPPADWFGPLSTHFLTELPNPGQREGMRIRIEQFAQFCRQVRTVLWTGL